MFLESISHVLVIFIRAPKVMVESAEATRLGKCDDQPTGLQQGCVMDVSFHFLNDQRCYDY